MVEIPVLERKHSIFHEASGEGISKGEGLEAVGCGKCSFPRSQPMLPDMKWLRYDHALFMPNMCIDLFLDFGVGLCRGFRKHEEHEGS